MRRKGDKSEKLGAAKYPETKATPNSGALWYAKGDFVSKTPILNFAGLLFENKFTEKKSFSLKQSDLEKIRKQALVEDYVPVFRVDFSGQPYIIIPEEIFRRLINENSGD